MALHVKTSCDEDIISGLPDDILHQILIRLDIKMAIKTGILSRRWKHLPALLHHLHLILEAKISQPQRRLRWKKNDRLFAFLNTFLAVVNPQTHPSLTSLSVEFDHFTRAYENLLQQCIKVALSRRLEHLMLWNRSAHYEFPLSCLSDELSNIGLQSLAISNCYTSTPCGFRIFHSLRKLVLYGFSLNADGERYDLGETRFQLLLASCSSLEVLSIGHSSIYPKLKINTPNQLKELTIDCCRTDRIEIMHTHKLEKLEIMSTLPGCCKFSMATLPCVKHLQLEFEYCYRCYKRNGYKLEKLSRSAPSLETLILSFNREVWLLDQKSSDVPFWKLRHLIVQARTSRAAKICSPFWISVLLDSAPCLESLEINIEEHELEYAHMPPPSDFSHINLKELKVKGFHNESMEIEIDLILLMLERVKGLERIILSRNGARAKQWSMTRKKKILDRLPVGKSLNPLITFT